jgi:hypothetical protein
MRETVRKKESYTQHTTVKEVVQAEEQDTIINVMTVL